MIGIELDPIVGNWYQHLDKGLEFQIVAVDDKLGTIEIQYFDGDIDELERSEWAQLAIELIEEPEDFSGSVDVVEPDDLGGTNVTDTAPEDWSEALRKDVNKTPDTTAGAPLAPHDEEPDDWKEGALKENLMPQEELENRRARAWPKAEKRTRQPSK